MTKYKIIRFIPLLFYLLFFSNSAFSQFVNLVPNSSFENGGSNIGNFSNSGLFDLYNWEIGYNKINSSGGCLGEKGTGNNSIGCFQTTTWLDYNQAVNGINNASTNHECHNASTNSFTMRCVHLDAPRDRIRVGLNSPVKAWKTYKLSVQILCYNEPCEVGVYLTHWGLHWNSNKSDNHKTHIVTIKPVADCIWKGYTYFFSTTEDMENLVFTVDYGEIMLDNVQITEESSCPDLLLQQNKNYNITEPTYEAYVIKSGSNVGDVNGIGPVTVKAPGGHISYKGVNQVLLMSGFSVEPGAYFHAYLAPCDKECFPPEAITGDVNDWGDDLCGVPAPGTTYQLGAAPKHGMTYVWTATPTSALSNLSATNISNPVFTPITTGHGTISYTLTVTNSCNEVASKVLVINYNTEGALNGYIDNGNSGDEGILNIAYNDAVSSIAIEVYNPNYSSLQHSFILYRGIDFTGGFKVWTYPYTNEFTCFNNYPIKFYYKTYCDDNWYPCSSPWSCPTTFYKNCSVVEKTDKLNNVNKVQNEIFITPNPNNGGFKVAVTRNNEAIGFKEIKVFDMMGKEIWSTGASASNTANVDISDYSQGIYYIKTVNELDEVEIKKLIKQ